MKRREFIKLSVAGLAWPFSARAQQSAVPVIGFLSSGGERAFAPMVAGFIRGLKETGFTEGQNILVEYRWAEGEYSRLPQMANELVSRRVTVLMASGGTVAARACKEATSTIPIVFSTADDPIANGLVTSLNRPGANITGVAFLSTELAGKRLGLVRELIPQAKLVALLVNAGNLESRTIIKDTQDAASSMGLRVILLDARTEGDIDLAFKTVTQEHAGALIVGTDPLYYIHRDRLIALAAREALPTVYFLRDFVASGGLMSYGSSFPESLRLARQELSNSVASKRQFLEREIGVIKRINTRYFFATTPKSGKGRPKSGPPPAPDKELGALGEQIIYLRELNNAKKIGAKASQVKWLSQTVPWSSYDIETVRRTENGIIRPHFVEVKSSAAEIDDNIFVSSGQVEFFSQNKDSVSIMLVRFDSKRNVRGIRELTPDELYDEFDLLPIKYKLRKRVDFSARDDRTPDRVAEMTKAELVENG